MTLAQSKRDANKKFRDKCKEERKCRWCAKPSFGLTLCPEHMKLNAKYRRPRGKPRVYSDEAKARMLKERKETYHLRKRLGLCVNCKEPVVPGRVRCEYHLELHADRQMERKIEQLEAGR